MEQEQVHLGLKCRREGCPGSLAGGGGIVVADRSMHRGYNEVTSGFEAGNGNKS